MIGESLIPRAQMPKSMAGAVAAKAQASAPAKRAATEVIEDFEVLLAAASPDAGKKTFKKCKACHTIGKGEASKVGPNLWNVVGADRAARDGFKYSDALSGLGGNWGYEELNAFLTKPKAYAPGTKMAFAGVKKAADRAAVIAFLRGQSDAPMALP
ncbi:MAG: cytochrome c family protein [Rhodospirillales bacterium]|nr:cytochrome c family protein [Rhodospirillales bacterium]